MRAIGGSYTLEKEMKLLHADREVLVVLGHAFIDSSCCGVAGCRYAFVPGYLQGWHDRSSEDGLPVSTVSRFEIRPSNEPSRRQSGGMS